ncbi:MAG: PLDc N-terminal domain-containing protein [Acidobacteriota bacterium]
MIFKLLILALDIIAISDVLSSEKRSIGEKLVLILLIMAFPILGAGLYLFVFREKK